MKILIDTHTLLWHLSDDHRLSVAKSLIIEDPNNEIYLSLASLWEMAIKSSIGKLDVGETLEELIPIGINILDIKFFHISRVRILPLHHKDPFDRLLIAQAICEEMHIMTDDANFLSYGVALI